jgi:D-arabinose 1-dehydrogenase-like Zn-dependent alcohol dehydrogenase
MNIQFNCLEYTSDDKFDMVEYFISRTTDDSECFWEIKRNGHLYLKLNSLGYILLKTLLCGICSTDLNRRFLPFPLPQITGHEILAESLDGENKYVIEISDSCISHNRSDCEIFCKSKLNSHCPDRMVIGINLLPGGFSPYIIVPINSAITYNKEIIPDYTAVMIEPFAAALNAIYTSNPKQGDQVAVLGPKKLGSLLIIALHAYKIKSGIDFKITAIIRRSDLESLCFYLGADYVILVENVKLNFDIIYDTSGTEEGFCFALNHSKREVHLKSTNGQTMCELNNLTAMVVDEISIIQLNEDNLNYKWRDEKRKNEIILTFDNNDEMYLHSKDFKIIKRSLNNINRAILEEILKIDEKRLPRFDLCIARNLKEIDFIIRPFMNLETSLLRPRGAILYCPDNKSDSDNEILNFLNHGGSIITSRCGDFHLAIKYLEEDSNETNISGKIQAMISHVLPAEKLNEAFALAKSKDVIKVIINHEKIY